MSKTVNFIDAVSSGKRFYNDFTSRWFVVRNNRVFDEEEGLTIAPTIDFINSDFKLEEKSITITESEFDEVFKNHTGLSTKEYFKKNLGF